MIVVLDGRRVRDWVSGNWTRLAAAAALLRAQYAIGWVGERRTRKKPHWSFLKEKGPGRAYDRLAGGADAGYRMQDGTDRSDWTDAWELSDGWESWVGLALMLVLLR